MLPLETITATFPPPVRVGSLALGPVTLAHAVAMEAFGVEVLDTNANDEAASCVGAWLLTKKPSELPAIVMGGRVPDGAFRWMERAKARPPDVAKALDAAFREAFSTYVRPKPEGVKSYSDGLPDGYGWPLEVAECLSHEYGRPLDEVLAWPLARAFALVAVMRQRNGGEAGGPDYYGRIREAAIRARLAKARGA